MASAPAAFKVHRLELFNFKSYLGKVSVGPFEDFTCIVGPNGSGKSNVMDALSFVLGASAATLRSSKLDDFVHKKAKKRECSVTLVMKSTAGDEKTFTRALNGNNSEYSVDGMRSNEKEFLGALRRLGLAARLSTFLVFQHEVDAVAQKKAKDLTDLIEQVSGSAELKAAYEACRKNLEEANKALMEAAVEKRGAQAELQQLKLHKVEAERFGDLQQKHAAERLSLAVAELFHIETQIHKHTEKLGEQTARLKELGSQDGATKALKQEYSTKHQQYLEELKRSRVVGAKHRDAKTTLERIRASVAHFTAKLARQQMQLTAAADTSKVRDKEVSRLKEQLDKVTKAWEMDQAKWAEEDAKSNKFASLSAKDLADYQQLRRDADIKTITERQSVETHKRERDALTEASKNVQLQLDRVDGTLGDFEAAVNAAQEKSTSISNRMQELEAEAKEVKAKLEEFKAAMQQSSLQKAKRDAEIKAIDEQLRELRYTKEENRHEQRVNEALESLKTLFPGVRGRFTDICTVKDKKKYAVAATVGFGGNMDAIIVDTTATAMACVRYLKEQRIASLSFIPVNNVDGDEVTDDLRALGAGTIPLIDLLSFNAEDVRAIRFAVGRTLVCDSMHTARHVAYGNKDVRRKVVVLDGTVLLKNGSIQGGLAAVEARARKWDDRQYNELKTRREQALAAAGGADSDADEMRAKQRGRELQSRLEFIESSLKRLEEERAASQKRIDGAAADRKKLAKQKADLDKQLADLKAKMQAIEGAIADLTRTIAAEEDKIFRDFQKKVGVDKISDLEREMQRKEKARAEVKHQFEIVKHKLTTAIKAESERVGETSATDISAAVKATEKELATAKRDEVTQSALVEKDRVGFETSQKTVAALKSALDSLENRIREAGRATAAEANLYQAARKQLSLTEAATEGLRAQRRSIFQRCRMEEIDLPLADPSNVKRGRDTDLVPSEAAAVIRTSELFNPNSGPAPSAVGSSTGRSSGRAPESVAIDFSRMDKSLRQVAKDAKTFQQFKKETEDTIRTLADEMESLAPNLKVSTHLQSSELKVQNVATDVGQAKERSQKAFRDFSKVKQERTSRFMKTFQSIVEHVDDIYRELTMGTRASDVHGSAYLLLEDTEEPYRAGTRYHATPPTKRFMEMQQLSGGERTMAAMALLFAIHATSPTPFFVLDEVDAALDAGNVEKLAQYIRKHASPSSQYIVVSLKEQLYHKADSLIGVYKDTSRESSNVMSLDLSQMPQLQAAPL